MQSNLKILCLNEMSMLLLNSINFDTNSIIFSSIFILHVINVRLIIFVFSSKEEKYLE